MRKKLLLLVGFSIFSTASFAQQNFWSHHSGKNIEAQRERTTTPTEYSVLKLNLNGLESQLMNAQAKNQNATNGLNIRIPNIDGTYSTYVVFESSVMHPDLQAKYPNTRSYSGYLKDNVTTKIQFSISPYFGFNAVIRSVEGMKYIDSFTTDNQLYIVYDRAHVDHVHTFNCKHDGSDVYDLQYTPEIDLGGKSVIDGKMRKYRLALATTIEYTAYIAQQAGVGSGTDAQKKAAVMDALNLAVGRLNEVYENNLSVQMEMVPNNDMLIFIDSDNYNPMNAGAMLGQNQTTVDNLIGSSNYDIGHVFFRATAGNDNGVAYLKSVCNNTYKAGGVTGAGNPVGDPFVIDYVAHEMGHQYGANHTQNNNCNRNNSTAVEPGSASTIMGYAGICHPNVQNNSDAYFHAVSTKEMYNWVTTGGNCAVKIDTGNQEPVISVGPNRTIPKETPFALVATATDADGDALTYNFEQTDTQTASMPPKPNNTGGPMFRSVMATDSPEKFFPRLSTIIEGYNPNINTPNNYRAWEKLPAVARTMNFALLVRDNNPAGGQSAREDIRLTVEANAGPFVVTSQSSDGIIWELGESQTITWDVANTNTAPVNTENVKIVLSTDGGLTFDHVLVESTPNNGSYTFNVPGGLGVTENARLMVRAIDNYFLNVNTKNFKINSSEMGVSDLTQSLFEVYPNPSNGVFTLEMDANSSQIAYSVYSIDGKLVSTSKINSNGGKVKQQVNLSHLPAGTYIVQVNNGNKTLSKKLIIR